MHQSANMRQSGGSVVALALLCALASVCEGGYIRVRRSNGGWTLLDPSTGRPIDSELTVPSLVRSSRQPENQEVVQDLVRSEVPLYKLRHRYPQGYGRRRRSAGWTLLDPSTGRPVDATLIAPSVPRKARQPVVEGVLSLSNVDTAPRHYLNTEGEYTPVYKYYKRYPYTG